MVSSGAYMPQNNVPAVNCVEQVLRAAPKVLGIILMGDLNKQLGDPREKREEDLAKSLVDRGLFNMPDHFIPRQRYRESDS